MGANAPRRYVFEIVKSLAIAANHGGVNEGRTRGERGRRGPNGGGGRRTKAARSAAGGRRGGSTTEDSVPLLVFRVPRAPSYSMLLRGEAEQLGLEAMVSPQ